MAIQGATNDYSYLTATTKKRLGGNNQKNVIRAG